MPQAGLGCITLISTLLLLLSGTCVRSAHAARTHLSPLGFSRVSVSSSSGGGGGGSFSLHGSSSSSSSFGLLGSSSGSSTSRSSSSVARRLSQALGDSSSSSSSSSSVSRVRSFTRRLRQALGDSGYTAWSNARVISPTAPKPPSIAQSFTDGSQGWGGDAESISASTFNGIDRLTVADRDRQTYATVTGVQSGEPPRDVTVEPRTRAINDRAEGPRRGTGNDIEFAIVNGGVSYSQTYEGARAVAGTDALGLSKGAPGKRRTEVTPIAVNDWFNWVPAFKPIRNASYGRKASVGVSAGNRVGALAMSGVANGKIALAQADSAVAMSQTERKRWDETRDWTPSDEP